MLLSNSWMFAQLYSFSLIFIKLLTSARTTTKSIILTFSIFSVCCVIKKPSDPNFALSTPFILICLLYASFDHFYLYSLKIRQIFHGYTFRPDWKKNPLVRKFLPITGAVSIDVIKIWLFISSLKSVFKKYNALY